VGLEGEVRLGPVVMIGELVELLVIVIIIDPFVDEPSKEVNRTRDMET
jgi:hypothetical protein